jgi:hypothetical protein
MHLPLTEGVCARDRNLLRWTCFASFVPDIAINFIKHGFRSVCARDCDLFRCTCCAIVTWSHRTRAGSQSISLHNSSHRHRSQHNKSKSVIATSHRFTHHRDPICLAHDLSGFDPTGGRQFAHAFACAVRVVGRDGDVVSVSVKFRGPLTRLARCAMSRAMLGAKQGAVG